MNRLLFLSLSLSSSSSLSLPLLSSRLLSSSTSKSVLIHGDALDSSIYKKLFVNSSAPKPNILMTDPPYCILTRRRVLGDLRDVKKRKRKLDDEETVTRFENIKSYIQFTKLWLENVISNCLSNSPTLIIWTNPLGKKHLKDLIENDFGFLFIGEYIWAKRTDHKSSSSNNSTKEVTLRVYETALVFKKEKNDNIDNNKMFSWSVITGYHDENETTRHEHPCHKPFKAIEPLVLNFTKPGDTIIDPFMGSGGILYCAQKIGNRNIYGIEKLDIWKNYCDQLLNDE